MKPHSEITYIILAIITFTGILLIYRILAAGLITRAALLNWNLA